MLGNYFLSVEIKLGSDDKPYLNVKAGDLFDAVINGCLPIMFVIERINEGVECSIKQLEAAIFDPSIPRYTFRLKEETYVSSSRDDYPTYDGGM